MKHIARTSLALLLSLAAATAFAADAPTKTLTPQQQRMKDCNGEAKATGKKGEERRAFMSTCLKGGSATAAAAKKAAPAKASAKAKPTAG
jgi:hypothetical protein